MQRYDGGREACERVNINKVEWSANILMRPTRWPQSCNSKTLSDKYIFEFGQIYFWIWTNIFLNLDKYISQFGRTFLQTFWWSLHCCPKVAILKLSAHKIYCKLDKYNFKFEQILFTIWTNTFYKLDKFISQTFLWAQCCPTVAILKMLSHKIPVSMHLVIQYSSSRTANLERFRYLVKMPVYW